MKNVVTMTVVGSLLCAFSSLAEVRTWGGDGVDASWQTLENWDNGVPVGGDSLVFEGDKNLMPMNDLDAGTSFAGITFGVGAAAFTLTGNGLVLEGNLVNNSDVAQRVGLPVAVSGVRTFNAAAGDIVLEGALSYSGSMTLVKQGAHELVIAGSNAMATASDDGRIQVLDGTLRFAKNSFFTMGNTSGERNILVSGNAANQKAKVVIEQDAYVSLGAFNIQTGGHAGNSFDMLIDGGHLNMPGTDNSFGDQGNSLMSILITNGGSLTNSAGSFNAGTRSPLAITVDNGLFAVNRLCFGRGTGGSERFGGGTTLDLREGVVSIYDIWELDTTGDAARTNVVTLGNGPAGKATFSVGAITRGAFDAYNILNFNAGEMLFRANMTVPDTFLQEVNIHEGGAVINVLSGVSVSIGTPLTPADGVLKDGGLTKRGPGALAFNSTACTFSGPIRVEDGMLRFSANLPQQLAGLYVAEGKTLSFRGSQHQTLRPAHVLFGGTNTTTTLELDIAANGTDPDTIHLPVDTTIGRLNVRLCERNSASADIAFSGAGDIVLFTYESEPPDVSLWTHANRPGGMTSAFIVDRANKCIILRMVQNIGMDTNHEWLNPLGGLWDIGTNWQDGSVPPDLPSTWCRLWDVLVTPSTVTVNREVINSGFSMRGANAYTLAGAGAIKLMHGDGYCAVLSDTGTHTVNLPLILTRETRLGASETSAQLNIDGAISGTGPLEITRVGTVSLSAPNTFTGGFTLSGGTLETAEGGAFGAGLLTFGGGRLNVLDTMTIPNTWAVSADCTLNIPSGKTLGLGDISAFANVILALPGEGTLELRGAADIANNVAIRPRAGTIRFVSGANYLFRTNNRDNLYLQGATASTPMRVEVEPGAMVMLGLRNVEGESSILVDGGTFILPASETTLSDNASGTLDIHVTNGGVFRQDGAHSFSVGVHGFTRITVDNGGTVSGSRVALGGNTYSANTRQGSCEVNISSGGTFEARDCFAWLSTGTAIDHPADLNILNGGTAIIPATVRDSASVGYNVATLTLDGGELVCSGLPINVWGTPLLANYLAGLDHFILGEDGGAIDVGRHDITITQTVEVPSAVTAADGLVKRGMGALTLAGGIDTPIPLTVAQGVLAVGGTLSFPDVTVADGAAIAVGNAWNVSGTLTFGAGSGIRWDGAHTTGTYTLATFGTLSGPLPSVINMQPGCSYVMVVNGNDLELIVTAPVNDSQWAPDADGSWDVGTNWTTDPNVPNTAGHVATFADIFTAPRVVSLSTPVSLSGLFFDAQHAPVLQGTVPLAFKPATSGGLPGIRVTKGAPVIEALVDVASGTTAAIASGATLTLANEVINAGPLNVTGPGTLLMSGTNLTAAVDVSGATLTLNGTSRQEAPVNLDGATLMLLDSISAAMPLTLGVFGATLAQPDSTVVAHEGAISGLGTLTRVGNGTLILPELPDVDLAIGRGTLAVTSTVKQVWAKNLRTGVDGQITILRNDGDIQLAGPVNGVTRFIKAGPGTLSYTYPGAMTLSANTPASTENAIFNIGPNGEAPTTGAYAYNILDGTVVMGVPGQVITLPNNVMVGGRTTDDAGAETEGHLVINGGVINIATLHIARGNGSHTTAPTPLQSSVTVNGGDVTLSGNINLGAFANLTATTFNARPRFTVNGGNVIAQRLLMPEVAGCTATVTVNGGELRLRDDVVVGSNSGGTGHLIVSNGLLSVANAINLGNTSGATGTLHIAGGVVEVVNVTKSNANGYGRILFDGGLFAPRAGPLNQPNEGRILAGGLKVKVLDDAGYTFNIPFADSGLMADAGFTKKGLGYLNVAQPLPYKGPTVIEEGELRLSLTNALPGTTSLTMWPGTSFQGAWVGVHVGMAVYNFTGLKIGEAAAAPVTVRMFLSQQVSDRFVIDGDVELGDVAFELCNVGSLDPSPYTGTYTLITYTGADPDVSGLTVANELPGHTYIFAASGGAVTLTVSAVSPMVSEIIWATGDGNWNTGTSWQSGTVPLATPKVANFPWQADPVAVTVDTVASIGGLVFGGNYTLDGANKLTLGAGASIKGGATVRTPLAVPDAAVTSVQPNNGRLTLGGDVAGANAALSLDTGGFLRTENNTVDVAVNIRDANGVLEVGEGSEITKDVTLFAGRIDAPGNGKVSGAVGLQFGQREIRPSSGCTLQLDGPVIGNAPLLINGAGRVELGAPNTYTGGTTVQGGGTLAFRAPATVNGSITLNNSTLGTAGTEPVTSDNVMLLTGNVTLNIAAPFAHMGDIAFSPLTTIRNISKAGTNEFAFGGAFYYSNTDTTGAGRLDLQDGIMRFLPGSRFTHIVGPGVRDQARANTVAGSTGGITVEPDAEVTLTSLMVRNPAIASGSAIFRLQMNGGLLTFMGDEPICLGDQGGDSIFVEFNDGILQDTKDICWTDLGSRSKVHWVMNGGTSTLARVAFGRQNGAGSGRNGGGVTLVISNGLWEARTGFSWKSTDDNNSASSVTLGCGEHLQGIFGVPPTARYHQGGTVTFNQNGGILRAFPVSASGGITGSPDNFLNGINAWNVGLGGAAVDVPDAGNAITITHAMTLAPEHGGFTKLGAGTLTLAQDLAVTGTVTVAEGTLKTDVTSTPDLHIGEAGCLDSQGNTANFRGVSGTGSAVNGTVTVSGILSPGDEAGEIGTLSVENLTFKADSTYRYDWSEEANDLIAISGTVSKEGPVTIDFGREENALDAPILPFTCVIGTYGDTSGSISGGWKVKNTGLPARIALNATVTAENGVLTLKVASGGTVMIVR